MRPTDWEESSLDSTIQSPGDGENLDSNLECSNTVTDGGIRVERIAYRASLQHSLLQGESRQVFEDDLALVFHTVAEKNCVKPNEQPPIPRDLPPPATKTFKQKKSHDVTKWRMTGAEITERAVKRPRTRGTQRDKVAVATTTVSSNVHEEPTTEAVILAAAQKKTKRATIEGTSRSSLWRNNFLND